MSDKVRIGIIGVGTIGSVHADAYAKVENAEVVALCDILPDRLEEKGARHGVNTLYQNYHDLLADPNVEAVSVCVPNYIHSEIAIAAFEAGKHVMLEKPMAMNPRQGLDICAARDRAGKVLQMGMVRRQADDSQAVKKMVEDGDLGEIYHIHVVQIRRRGIPGLGGWFTTKAKSGGGPIIDIGVHSFDLAMWLSNLWEPTAVSAMTYAKFGSPMENYHYVGMWAGPPNYGGVFDVEDYACGLVRFGRKATMNFDIAWAANSPGANYVEILGDRGGLRLGDGPLVLLTEHNTRLADIKIQYPGGTDPFVRELEKFAAAVRGEAPPAATGEEGVVALKIIAGIYESAEKGCEVPIS